jgi:hypothetical protein
MNPLTDLSPHLFWDVDISKLDIDRSRKFVIGRILDYGTIDDWRKALRIWSIYEIGDSAESIRDLSLRSAGFISLLAKRPIEKFICFTSKRSTPAHLSF